MMAIVEFFAMTSMMWIVLIGMEHRRIVKWVRKF